MSRGHTKPLDKDLLRIDSWIMVKKVAVFLLLLATGGAGILSGSVIGAVAGTLVVGAMFAHGVELTHQFLHGTGFRNRTANRVAGFLCAVPMLVSHSQYKTLHLGHHRNLGTPANTEFFHYGTIKGKHFLVVFARSFSPVRYLKVARNILGAVLGRAPDGAATEEESRAIRLEYLVMLALIAGAVAFTAITRSDLVLRLWLIPLVLVAESIHFWVELPEHFGCELDTRNVLFNTRTIQGSWLSFWFTNGNNFHVEHHLYPRIAIDKLPRVHRAIRDDIQCFNRSYWAFLRTALRPEAASPDPVDAGGAPAGDDAGHKLTLEATGLSFAGDAPLPTRR